MFSCAAFNLQDWLLLSQYCQAFQPCNAEPGNLSQACSLRNKYKVVRLKAFTNESYARNNEKINKSLSVGLIAVDSTTLKSMFDCTAYNLQP